MLICETCGVRAAAGVDDLGDVECAECAERWAALQAREAAFTRELRELLELLERHALAASEDERISLYERLRDVTREVGVSG